MTRSTNMEHVEVLRHMKETIKAIMPSEVAALDAAIASLSAPQPPAEAQPVAWQYQDRDGKWHGFTDESHRLNTIEDGSWPVRALYAHPPPSAPVGAEGLRRMVEKLAAHVRPTCRELWEEAQAVLAQQPAACVGFEGKPTPENTPCAVCGQQPAAVNDLNAWRAAFIAERAMRYRESGMAIEQARIHAETDAARMEALVAGQQPAAVDEAMVERLAQAVATELYGEPPQPGSNSLTRAMMLPGIKRALTAALAGQQEDPRPFGVLTDMARSRLEAQQGGEK